MTQILSFYWPLLVLLAWPSLGWFFAYKLSPQGWQESEPLYGWFVIVVCGAIAGPLIIVVDWLDRELP